MRQWEPHVFTSLEREAVQLEGLRYKVIIEKIEKIKEAIFPEALPVELQSCLALAKHCYLLRYFLFFQINALPNEIIREILRFAVSQSHSVDARLNITWTCRRWRGIAINDSTLWTKIWFCIGAGAHLDRAWAWLDRACCAASTLLDIRIDGTMATGTGSLASDMQQVFTRLSTKLSSIRVLIVSVPDWETVQVVLEILRGWGLTGMSTLEWLELRCAEVEPESEPSVPLLGGVALPALEHLTLEGVPICWSQSSFQYLTSLDFIGLPPRHFPSSARFREILMNCRRLNKLSLVGSGPQVDESNHTPVQLPFLHTLHLANFSCCDTGFLLRQFSAPEIKDLTLFNLGGGAGYLPAVLLLSARFPKVRLLTAGALNFGSKSTIDGSGSAALIARWLKSMPLLVYFTFMDLPSQFLAGFHYGVAHCLAVVHCRLADPAVFLNWVKNRQQLGPPLRTIYVSEEFLHQMNTDQLEELTRLSENLSLPCSIATVPHGVSTPEEQTLMSVSSY
ncbi:hypothetical protein C8R43DRAFT_887326 [Mycena crocata]|nr:hypothetical protein C8R43DRAFT_897189 [Mycena crocata]KAJ7150565.1 hypothetical protein C8R43DRAFT_887326 [Mycena crocata]